MQLVEKNVSVKTLKHMSEKMFGGLVKAVIDVKKEIMVIDADMHADEEEFLLEQGSLQQDLWGINLHPDLFGNEKFVEFDSMINLRPSNNNRTRGIENAETRKKIVSIVQKLVIK